MSKMDYYYECTLKGYEDYSVVRVMHSTSNSFLIYNDAKKIEIYTLTEGGDQKYIDMGWIKRVYPPRKFDCGILGTLSEAEMNMFNDAMISAYGNALNGTTMGFLMQMGRNIKRILGV